MGAVATTVFDRKLTKANRPKDLPRAIRDAMFEPEYADYLGININL
jgi:hypothetical protein